MGQKDDTKIPGLSKIHYRILEVLKAHPEGVTLNAIASELQVAPGRQIHFNRRFRDLYPVFEIGKIRVGRETAYQLKGRRAQVRDTAPISKALRAQVLHLAYQQCAMCGRTVEKHKITLVVDHKLPRTWGGTTELHNLWALCSECNEGKRDFFSSVDSPEVRQAMKHKSVHVRLGELLKSFRGRPVPSSLLELVAGQSDWMKRLRELRYLGWKIGVSRQKHSTGRVEASYSLASAPPWPRNPTAVIRAFEKERAQKNRENSRLAKPRRAL